MAAILQTKLNAQNEKPVEEAVQDTNAIWEGDPGDGTDFIPVIDLPIEDQAAIPTYDIFDRPTTPQVAAQQNVQREAQKEIQKEPEFDFTNIITSNGVLEVMPDGYGFLRSSDYNYLSSPDDV